MAPQLLLLSFVNGTKLPNFSFTDTCWKDTVAERTCNSLKNTDHYNIMQNLFDQIPIPDIYKWKIAVLVNSGKQIWQQQFKSWCWRAKYSINTQRKIRRITRIWTCRRVSHLYYQRKLNLVSQSKEERSGIYEFEGLRWFQQQCCLHRQHSKDCICVYEFVAAFKRL